MLPPVLCRHTLMPLSSWFGPVMQMELWGRWNKGIKLPQCWQMGSLNSWVGVFCIKLDDGSLFKSLTQRGVHPFHTAVVLLPCSRSVSSCGGHLVCYPLESMGWCLSLHQTHMSLLAILSRKTSTATAHHLESSPIFSGCSSWHPQEKQ